MDSYRTIDRKSAVDRSLRYPYEIPTKSYIFDKGESRDISVPFSDLIDNKIAVIGYGSNSAAEALDRKYKDYPDLYDIPIPVLVGNMENFSVVYSAQFSPYGTIPATIQPNKGAQLTTAITFLTQNQLLRMHDTEDVGLYYSYEKIGSPIILEDGLEVKESYSYVALGGSIKIKNNYLGLSAIQQNTAGCPCISQREVQEIAIETLGLSLTVEDFIIENALNENLRNSRFRELSEKVGEVWQK